jgi:C6 transcription factor Pro1
MYIRIICFNTPTAVFVLTKLSFPVFEKFFTAQGNEWKIHLRAATNMQQRYFRDNLIEYGLSKGAGAILRGERNFSMDDGLPVLQEIMIYKFFTGVIIWLDIISSITAGSAPHLLSHHFRDIPASSPWIKLEEIMGCQNQVMLQIGRIAALYEHKTQILRKGHLVNTRIEETARDISREIESCLAQTALEGLSFSDGRNTPPVLNPMVSMNSPTLVTHMFALMAAIYLHLVIYGFQELELLESASHRAMKTLNTQVPAHLLPAMVCPLYVIGSVARQEEERVFFRKLFSSPPLLDPLFENRTKVLPALEEIWRQREIRNDLTWEDSLELVPDLLLL